MKIEAEVSASVTELEEVGRRQEPRKAQPIGAGRKGMDFVLQPPEGVQSH
jgi:hypothetical protein